MTAKKLELKDTEGMNHKINILTVSGSWFTWVGLRFCYSYRYSNYYNLFQKYIIYFAIKYLIIMAVTEVKTSETKCYILKHTVIKCLIVNKTPILSLKL